jgi:hypothetical protein
MLDKSLSQEELDLCLGISLRRLLMWLHRIGALRQIQPPRPVYR